MCVCWCTNTIKTLSRVAGNWSVRFFFIFIIFERKIKLARSWSAGWALGDDTPHGEEFFQFHSHSAARRFDRSRQTHIFHTRFTHRKAISFVFRPRKCEKESFMLPSWNETTSGVWGCCALSSYICTKPVKMEKNYFFFSYGFFTINFFIFSGFLSLSLLDHPRFASCTIPARQPRETEMCTAGSRR